MTILLAIIIIAVAAFIIRSYPMLGKLPTKNGQDAVSDSPNFRMGEFRNQEPTTLFSGNGGRWETFRRQFFTKHDRVRPKGAIPAIKIDIKNISTDEDIAVWFGHSSYYIQTDGKKILVDPVFSSHLSPVPGVSRAFKGTDIYSADDMPEIDCLVITHDHWDHLDHNTVKRLGDKVKKVICPLGVGSHMRYWGYPDDKVFELDWYDSVTFDPGFTIYAVPSRHFSGRFLKSNQTLWMSCLLQTPSMKIFLGGDGGYGPHFAEVGERFGTIDLAFLENGQYNDNWRFIHMKPDEVAKAAKDLNAKRVLPIHSGKFALASHPWNEPLEKLTGSGETNGINIITPVIGEIVNLKDPSQRFSKWWTETE